MQQKIASNYEAAKELYAQHKIDVDPYSSSWRKLKFRCIAGRAMTCADF